MKHGCMFMTLRLSSSRRSGSHQIHRCRKKGRQVHSNVKSMLIFFFDIQGTVHKEFIPPVKPSIASFTVRFWSGWWRAFGANVQTSGRTTIGFSTVTTRPLTHHSLFDNSWLPKTLQWFPTLLFAWPRPPATFYYSPRLNYGWKGVILTRLRRSTKNRRGYRHTHILELPGMHEIMGNTLGSLYTCPSGLLRRRRWKLGVTLRHFFMVKFPEFLGSTSYIGPALTPTYWNMSKIVSLKCLP